MTRTEASGPTRRGGLMLIAALLVVSACSREAVIRPPIIDFAWDTSSAQIVVVGQYDVDELPAFTLAQVAFLDVGGVGSSEELFGAEQGYLDSNGRMVVADRGNAQVVTADRAGPVRRFGAKGEGPGEFMGLRSVHQWAGDSIVAYDRALRRLSIFDSEGVYRRSVRLDVSLPSGPELVALMDDGLVVRSYQGPEGYAIGRGGETTRVLWLNVVSIDGKEVLDTLGLFPQGREYVYGYRPTLTIYRRPVPFGSVSRVSASGGSLVVALTGPGEIGFLNPDGSLQTLTRFSEASRPLTATLIRRHLDSLWAAESTEGVRALYADLAMAEVVPERGPAIGQVLVAESGNVWVEIPTLHPEEVDRWVILGPSGEPIASAHTPRGLEVLWVGRSRILTRRQGDLGVEELMAFDILSRPSKDAEDAR